MGALAIVLWIIAFSAGAFFPPLFIAPLFATYLWFVQRERRKQELVYAANVAANLRKCDQCAEFVKVEAKVCRFCGHTLPKQYPVLRNPPVAHKQRNHLRDGIIVIAILLIAAALGRSIDDKKDVNEASNPRGAKPRP